MSKQQFIQDLIEPLIQGLGYVFWGLKLTTAGRKSRLQIFIDHKEGIGLDDCEKVANHVGALLDVEDPISGRYELEVSSPGLDREFFKLSQCTDYLDQRVRVQLLHKFEDKKKFNAKIVQTDMEKEKIVLLDEMNESIEIDFALIQRIQLIA